MTPRYVCTIALALLISIATLGAATQPFATTVTLTEFGGGTQEQHGNMFQIRDLEVTADVTGDLVGTTTYSYNGNFNLVTGIGHTYSVVTITTTGGLCVGEFGGVATGTSAPGDFPDQDSGTFELHGSGGCTGIKIHGTFTEPTDGVFSLVGFSIQ